MNQYTSKDLGDVLVTLKSRTFGLNDDEVLLSRQLHGSNELPRKNRTSPLIILFSQFKSVLVIILLITGVISWIIGEVNDSLAIWLILFVNATIGFWQEYRAEKTLESLRQYETSTTKVIRNNKLQLIDSKNLVVGDIVEYVSGDRISADCRIIEDRDLQVNESLLTGESENIEKTSQPIKKLDLQLHEMKNIVFSGTTVVEGRLNGLVIKVGKNTELGKIAQNLSADKKDETNLQNKLRELGYKFAIIGILLMVGLYFLGIALGNSTREMFLLAVSVGVSSIPEGLPVITTVALALGVQRMAKKFALIRKLPAVEALSSVEIICVDKTGTLTQNQMSVSSIFTISNNDAEKAKFKEIVVNCNDANLETGNQTEIALNKYFFEDDEALKKYQSEYERILELTFSSKTKYMAVLTKNKGNLELLVKGAYDRIIDKCTHIYIDGEITPLTPQYKNEIGDQEKEYAKNGSRVISVAFKKFGSKTSLTEDDMSDLVLVGLAAISDPPRLDVRDAISKTILAGIRIIMITGDQMLTAQYIAKEVGIIDQDDKNCIGGSEMKDMTVEQLQEKLKTTNIFYRIEPEQKLLILEQLQKMNYQVAMTGDGVNDALALKKANIGLVMNSGTDIAKDVSDVVLLNNNFSPIPDAIEEGRKIFSNIRKFLILLITTNFGEVLLLSVTLMLRLPLPFLPIHILWLNLVSDGLPAIALANDKVSSNLMKKLPASFKSLTQGIWKLLIIGTFIDVSIASFSYYIFFNILNKEVQHAQTMMILCITSMELLQAFSIRAKAFDIKFMLNNKLLNIIFIISISLQILIVNLGFTQKILRLSQLNIDEWLYILIIPILFFLIMELLKLVFIGRRSKMLVSKG